MTEEQLEAIARAYCKNIGLDPDVEIIGYDGKTQKTSVPRWKAELYEIRKHAALRAAFNSIQPVILAGH